MLTVADRTGGIAAFRAEADMLSVIAANSSVFNVRAIPLFEIPTSTGVPDVVLVRFSAAGLRERTDRSFLLDLTDVKTMLAATSVPRTQVIPLANLAERHSSTALWLHLARRMNNLRKRN